MNPGVDEPARGIDHARGLRVIELADRNDAAVLHRDVGREPRIAGAIHDAPVPDQQVVALGWLCGDDREECCNERDGQG